MRKRLSVAFDVGFSLLLFVTSWALRAISASSFVTWDEPAWVYRSVKFLMALSRGDWAGTLLVGHPGVVTMWSGALSLAWHRFVGHAVTPAQLGAIDRLPTLEIHDPDLIRQLGALLPFAKGGILWLNAAIVLALFWLLRRLLDRRYAVAGALLLALDPFYLALGRVLHIDALTSGFMLLALLCLLIYAQRASRRYLLLSGAAAGLAALTKATGLAVGPAVAIVLIASHVRGALRRDVLGAPRTASQLLLAWARDMALWGAVALGVFVLIWPAIWVSPLNALKSMASLSLDYATTPGDATATFFLGQTTRDVGASFYPIAILFRSTPLLLAGCVLALLGLLLHRIRGDRGASTHYATTTALLAYVTLYVALITLARKKFDRYALPALLALDVLAALGIVGLCDLAARRASGQSPFAAAKWRVLSLAGAPAAASSLILLQGALLLGSLYPAHYLAYYNPWVGGPSRAVEMIPVGWGEGIEYVADYLSIKPEAASLTVATWAVAGLAPAFPGRVVTLTPENISQADYVLLYLGDVQAPPPLEESFYRGQEPELVVKINGIPYAWLYANTYYAAISQEIAGVAQAHDAVVSNAPSAFQRHYDGDLVWYVIEASTDAEIAEGLSVATQGATHLFYVQYEDAKPSGESIRRQLAQNALLLWEKPFPYGTVSYYLLPEGASFRSVSPSVAAAVNYGQQLLLEGYGLSSTKVEYRQEIGLSLRWRALGPLDRDYHLFVHLVDEQGQQWGQRDLPLEDSDSLRTTAWQEGTAHLSHCSVSLEAGIPPGPYWLSVGLYDLDDLSRLAIVDQAGQIRGTEFRIGPVEVTPARVPPFTGDLAIQHPTDLELGQKIRLLGYALSPALLQSGEDATMTLFWQCLERMDANYVLGVSLQDGGERLDFERVQPAGPHHSTDRWEVGEVLRYPHALSIPPDAASGAYQVHLNLYHVETNQPLAPTDLLLTQLEVEHRERLYTAPPIAYPMRLELGDQIGFLGYDLLEDTLSPGGMLHLTLYWQALRPPDLDYTVFTHLLDSVGALRGQRDGVPMMGQRPTSGWTSGEIIIDPYELAVHSDAPAGPGSIEVGMYDPATGERLPVRRQDGSLVPERRILLDQVVQIGE